MRSSVKCAKRMGIGNWGILSDEWWMMSDEWWVAKIEWGVMSDEKKKKKSKQLLGFPNKYMTKMSHFNTLLTHFFLFYFLFPTQFHFINILLIISFYFTNNKLTFFHFTIIKSTSKKRKKKKKKKKSRDEEKFKCSMKD